MVVTAFAYYSSVVSVFIADHVIPVSAVLGEITTKFWRFQLYLPWIYHTSFCTLFLPTLVLVCCNKNKSKRLFLKLFSSKLVVFKCCGEICRVMNFAQYIHLAVALEAYLLQVAVVWEVTWS